jgi:hypothetical protein
LLKLKHKPHILLNTQHYVALYTLSASTSVSAVSIIPPMLHTHSSIYHQRCIMFLSQYFSFPCQYHSTNAPYSSHTTVINNTSGRGLGTFRRINALSLDIAVLLIVHSSKLCHCGQCCQHTADRSTRSIKAPAPPAHVRHVPYFTSRRSFVLSRFCFCPVVIKWHTSSRDICMSFCLLSFIWEI